MVRTLFLLAAIVLFAIAAFLTAPVRVNFTALGLVFLAAAHLDLPLP